jgi:hypothetical protein
MIVRARFRDTAVSLLTLLLSGGTLLCCALPLMLITLGLGSVVAYMTNALPWLVTLSHYKPWMFLISGVYLTLIGWLIYRPGRSCPADPELARLCARADRFNRTILWVAIGIFAIGFFAAYLLFPLRTWLKV